MKLADFSPASRRAKERPDVVARKRDDQPRQRDPDSRRDALRTALIDRSGPLPERVTRTTVNDFNGVSARVHSGRIQPMVETMFWEMAALCSIIGVYC